MYTPVISNLQYIYHIYIYIYILHVVYPYTYTPPCPLPPHTHTGYFFTVAFVEIMGRKTIQYMGFAMMTLLLVLMAALFDVLHANPQTVWGFLVLYALCFFFANFGPNATTFIIPGESVCVCVGGGRSGFRVGSRVFRVSGCEGSGVAGL